MHKNANDVIEFWIKRLLRIKQIEGGENGNRYLKYERPVVFVGERHKEYIKLVDEMWQKDSEIAATYSKRRFSESVIKIISVCLVEQKEPKVEDARMLREDILSKPAREMEVYKPVFGIHFPDNDPITIDIYTFYKIPLHEQNILSRHPNFNMVMYERKGIDEYYVSVIVHSRDDIRAGELFATQYERLVHILNFIVVDPRTDVFISTTPVDFGFAGETRVMSGELGSISGPSFIPSYLELKASDYLTPEFESLWKLNRADKLSKMEVRIITAVEWIGKALVDKDQSKAFVQLIFAIEALLQYRPQDPIFPGIGHQIAESLAFILEEIPEKRMKVFKLFKELYNKRSAIAHGGTSDITMKELRQALYLGRIAVLRLLNAPEFEKLQTIDSLMNWIQSKRFSN